MFKKSVFTLLLVVSLILGIATASYAGNDKGHGRWKLKGQGKWKAIQLTDVNSHWAEQSIRAMSQQGIVQGYSDFTFRPDTPVTKFEAIMMIAKASGFNGTFDANHSWDDSVPQWMRDCLNYAVNKGILSESDAADFKGWVPAKRYEVAVWASKAMNLEQYDRLSYQDLSEIPEYARPCIGGLFRSRYMVGYSGNVFQPNKPITRAELAVVLYRIMQGQQADGQDNYNEIRISSLSPADGSNNIDPATRDLVARFNTEIRAVYDLQRVKEGIRVRNVTDGRDVDLDWVSIKSGDLSIRLRNSLESNKTYRVTLDSNLIEATGSGRNFEGISGSQWEFSTLQNGSYNELRISSLSPADGSNNIDPATRNLVARFNRNIQVIPGWDLLNAVKIYNRSHNNYVDIYKVEINQDSLLITLEETLARGDTFEVTIKADYFEAEYGGENFAGINGSDWRFSTRN